MKKGILIAVVLSLLCVGAAYYFFFMKSSAEEETKLPAKVSVVVKKDAIPSVAKPAASQTASQPELPAVQAGAVPVKDAKKSEMPPAASAAAVVPAASPGAGKPVAQPPVAPVVKTGEVAKDSKRPATPPVAPATAAPVAKPDAAKTPVPSPVQPVKAKSDEKVKKEEPKKPDQKKDTMAAVKKSETKVEMKKAVVSVSGRKQRKVAKVSSGKAEVTGHYKIEYAVKDEYEAAKVRDGLVSIGYHTARYSAVGGSHLIVISPFTDKWEAQYVRDNIVRDTGIPEFTVKPIR